MLATSTAKARLRACRSSLLRSTSPGWSRPSTGPSWLISSLFSNPSTHSPRRRGFVWRLQTDEGNATAIQAFEWDAGDSAGVIINLSVWTDVENLAAFVFGDMHREVMRRRREWFHRMTDAYTVCWWVPAGHRPTPAEAEDRIRNLRANGPNPHAFTIRERFDPPGVATQDQLVRGDDDWLCPV
jgi:Domain of unknown function (DUF3291)